MMYSIHSPKGRDMVRNNAHLSFPFWHSVWSSGDCLDP